MAGLAQDLRYSVRALRAQPASTLVALLILALGIGATIAVFSVVNGVLLRPLPYRESDRLVAVRQTWQDYGPGPTTPPNFKDWRERASSFESLAAYYRRSANLSGDGPPEHLDAASVTAGFFAVMRAQPAEGRGFRPQQDRPGADRVVVISHGLWRRRFGGDHEVIGRVLRLNGESHTIVGVAPTGFRFPGETDVWTPACFDYAGESRSFGYISVVGRLGPGVGLEQARADMRRVGAQLEHEYPDHNSGCGVAVDTLRTRLVGNVRPALWALLGSVALVLLVAAANVTSLLLGRATTRQRELAIRQALGASRSRVVRLSMTESLLLALTGGGLGVLLAELGTDGLLRAFSKYIPRASEVGVDGNALAVALVVSLVIGVGTGLVPALQGAPRQGLATLWESGRALAGSRRSTRALRFLVISEVALAVVLLVGAFSLIRGFAALVATEPGFVGDHVLAADVELADSKYDEESRRASFYRDALARLRALPGVEAASSIYPLPLDGGFTLVFTIDGKPVEKPSERPDSNFRIAGPGYFETMGIARIAGRSFDSNDTADKPLVAVVNRSFAKRFFPEGHVLGRRVSFDRNAGAANADWFTVVGVVGDVRGNALDSEAGEEIYVCSTQVPYPKASLVVRTHGRPGAMAGAVRSAVLAVDADLPIFNVRPVSAVVGGSVGSIRFSTVLLGLFAAVALLLASIGVYGMLSFSVGQRAREVGIRLALGANRIQVADLVVRRGMGPVVAGIALGSIGALGLAGFLSSRVFGASAMDAWTFAGVGATLLFAALLASIVPTVRMTRIDSATVLREE